MSRKKDPPTPFGALKGLRDQLRAEEEAREKAEAERRREAREAGKKVPAPRPRVPPAPVRKPGDDVWRPDLDKELFDMAMSGVRPLEAKPSRVSARDPSAPHRVTPEAKARRARAEGGPGLEVRWAEDGTVTGVRAGRSFALEALGRFATPEETLDLHGYEPSEAARKASEFVRTRRARGLRCVCVVHGRGRNSPDGSSVVRDAVVEALGALPAANELDAFASAPEDLGGAGALLISLRS